MNEQLPHIETKPFETDLKFQLKRAESNEEKQLCNQFLRTFHYVVGQERLGRRIVHYSIDSLNRLTAVLTWSNPLSVLNPYRDKFLGIDAFREEGFPHFTMKGMPLWSYEFAAPGRETDFAGAVRITDPRAWNKLKSAFLARYANRIFADNSRYCVCLAIENRSNLASQVLAASRKQVVLDWKEKYGDDLILLETFVDTTKFEGLGSCYKADNWKYLYTTKGVSFHGAGQLKSDSGKRRWDSLPKDAMKEGAVPRKAYYVYPVYDEKETRHRLETLLGRFYEKTVPRSRRLDEARASLLTWVEVDPTEVTGKRGERPKLW